jgi:hypothetical protein
MYAHFIAYVMDKLLENQMFELGLPALFGARRARHCTQMCTSFLYVIETKRGIE